MSCHQNKIGNKNMLKQEIQQLTLHISTGIIRIFPTLYNDTNDIIVRYDNDDLELVF